MYRKASVVITKISQRIQNEKKKEKEFSLTAESYDTSWVDAEMDSSKILCLCKHKTNVKLKALGVTKLESISDHDP